MCETFNRTAYGIEIEVRHDQWFLVSGLLIAPLMELKSILLPQGFECVKLLIAPLMELKWKRNA